MLNMRTRVQHDLPCIPIPEVAQDYPAIFRAGVYDFAAPNIHGHMVYLIPTSATAGGLAPKNKVAGLELGSGYGISIVIAELSLRDRGAGDRYPRLRIGVLG